MSKENNWTVNQLTDLRIQRTEIEKEIRRLEHKCKSTKGIGKNGQFYITTCKDQEDIQGRSDQVSLNKYTFRCNVGIRSFVK